MIGRGVVQNIAPNNQNHKQTILNRSLDPLLKISHNPIVMNTFIASPPAGEATKQAIYNRYVLW